MRSPSKAALLRWIRANWEDIRSYAVSRGATRCGLATFPQVRAELLGESLKVWKGEAEGYKTAILYLSPSLESGRNTCAWASAGCSAACLVGSGQLSMQENARLWKTALYWGCREAFEDLLGFELASLEAASVRAGMVPCARLDGTSDLGLARKFSRVFPGIRFYDYTKSPKRALKAINSEASVTFSYSGHNGKDARKVLKAGGTVAVAFNALPAIKGRREADTLPSSWRGFPVIDGDETDLRFTDPKGVVVGLRFKASADRGKRLKLAGRFVQACRNS